VLSAATPVGVLKNVPVDPSDALLPISNLLTGFVVAANVMAFIIMMSEVLP
jgi:hypothetical protein